MGNDTTLVLDIKAALTAADREAKEKPAAFLVVGGDLNGTIFDLIDQSVTVGRNANNSIVLEFQGISRYHCQLQLESGSYILMDTGSKNGTYLNNQKLSGPTKLNKGDIVKIGSIALKYLPPGDPERLTYDKLKLDASTDTLTKCYNKGFFSNSLELEVKKSKLTGTPLALLIFDLDHFKKINDTYGHDAGDYVLKEMAKTIRLNGVRDHDVFARYGGEEFVILLPKTNLKQAYDIAERLRKLIEKHEFVYEKSKLPITASIGVADYRQGVLNGTDLFRRADNAVYKAKEGGRNQVQFYHE